MQTRAFFSSSFIMQKWHLKREWVHDFYFHDYYIQHISVLNSMNLCKYLYNICIITGSCFL